MIRPALKALWNYLGFNLNRIKREFEYKSTSPFWYLKQVLHWLMFKPHLAEKRGFTVSLKSAMKRMLGILFRRAALFLSTRPALRSKCVGLLKAIGIYDGSRKTFSNFSRSIIAKRAKAQLSEQHLTSRGRDLYRLLKKSVEARSEYK